MEKYRFTLDDIILIRNPENWKDIEVTIERQKDIEGLLLIFTSNLTFVQDGYNLLRTQFDLNYNNKITASIDRLDSNDVYVRLFTGAIRLSDIQFNLNKKTAIVKMEDVSFFGGIDHNKNVKTFLNSEFTKNGVKITTPTAFQLDYFTPTTGVFFGFVNRDHYLVSDALDFLVRFMTDDEVKGIVSTYLTTASNFEGGLLYITTGEEIRTGTGLHPNVSFKELFQFLKRTHNISFVIEEDSNGDPIMRIEEKAFFFESTTSFIAQNIKDLELTVDKQKLFSHLEVGNKTFEKSGNFSSTTRFFSFRDEDYSLEGKANVDKLLDFKTDFVTDNNVIEKIVVTNIGTGDDEFDEDNIIVTGNTGGTATIAFTSPNHHYNKGLTNDQIILRQINSIPNSIAKYLTAQTTPSRAATISEYVIGFLKPGLYALHDLDRVNYRNDSTGGNFDLGANYNEVSPNFFYEIPFNGKFTFKQRAGVNIEIGKFGDANFITGSIEYRLITNIRRLNSAQTTTIQEHIVSSPTLIETMPCTFPPCIFGQKVSSQITMDCSLGEKIIVSVILQVFSYSFVSLFNPPENFKSRMILSAGSFFACLGADNDAGVYQVFDPKDFRALIYKFQKNTNFTDFNTLTSQSLRRIRFNEGSDPALDKLAWIDKINYKVETSEADFQLIT